MLVVSISFKISCSIQYNPPNTVNPEILTNIIFNDLARSDNLTAININYVHSVMFRIPGFSKAALSTLVF